MPTDSLKKESPTAVSTVSQVTALQSGLKRNARPSLTLDRVRLRMLMMMRIPNSMGKRRLVIASIPRDTPARMIAATQASTTHCQISDCQGLLTRALKASPVTAGSVLFSPPLIALGM